MLKRILIVAVVAWLLHLVACEVPAVVCSETKPCPGGAVCINAACACPESTTLCGTTCVNVATDAKHCGNCDTSCDASKTCVQGLCQCPAPQKDCHGTCTDVQTNAKHCGRCGVTCLAGQRCVKGQCLTKCPDGTPDLCTNQCVNLQENDLNCGTCGNACHPSQRCTKGTCTCPEGTRDCNGKCVDPRANTDHCGACNTKCSNNDTCTDGRCTPTCSASTPTLCLGSCVNTQQNKQHCGTCGNACGPQEKCIDGVCQCPTGQQQCNGTCVDIRTNPSHCGSCGQQCATGKVCSNGTCLNNCPDATETVCFGGCFDLQNDVNHCGKCGNACPGLQVCDTGKCVCPKGWLWCDNKCIDPQTDPIHCGKCNTVCPTGNVCITGKCEKECPAASPTECSGGCFDTNTSNKHCGSCGQSCRGGKYCDKGQCTCGSSKTSCNGLCTDLTQDRLNCGACGRFCKTGENCINGQCQLGCGKQVACGDICVDPQTDDKHCGTCNNPCKGDERCIGGTCQCKNDRVTCGGICVDTQTDTRHCGACNNACTDGKICNKGTCELVCANTALTVCGTNCVDLQSDAKNCGTCGTKCPTGQGCSKGKCICPPGESDCNGLCVDTQTSALHCGQCDNKCPGKQYCDKGTCRSCTDAQPLQCGTTCCKASALCCGQQCTDPQTDSNHCGACNNKCAANQQCTNGKCICVNGAKESCYTGPSGTQGKGLCKAGTKTCNNGVWGACVGQTRPVTERCDGKDNDCDGRIDENWSNLGSTCATGTGECRQTGAFVCNTAQTNVVCNAVAKQPTTEVCNNKDDDCDGSIDENVKRSCYTGPSGTRNKGRCKDGQQTCSKGAWGSCIGQIRPTTETCNKVDDDCDGQTDENNPGGGAACSDPTKQGECKAGTRQCQNGTLTCISNTSPKTETCNNKDDNCNGQIDDGVFGSFCPLTRGVCQGSRQKCVNGAFQACTTSNYGTNYEATETKCDGKDNDCDGKTDEELERKGPLCSKQKGFCATSRQSCRGGTWATCTAQDYGVIYQTTETLCDGRDNDCDGQIDEGCQACTPSILVRTFTIAGSPSSFAVAPTGNTLAVGRNRYTVDLYNYVTGSLIRNMSNSSVSMGLNYSHRDKILAGGGIRFHIFDLGTYLKQQKGSTAANHVSFNPRANQAVVNSTGTTATIWDMNTRTLIRTLSGHTSSLRTNDWSFDGKFIATAGLDKTIILWNPTNGAKIRTINTGHTSTIVDVAISPNNQYIASLSQDKTLKLWRASNGTQVWSKTITSVFSRARMSFRWDSLQLALGNDKALEIRTTSTGNVARTLTGHTNTVGFVSWTPDGRHIISVGFDNQIRVWRCQ